MEIIVETSILFLVIIPTLYSVYKLLKDPPRTEKAQNLLAVVPSWAGIIAYLFSKLLWTTENPYILLSSDVLPTSMVGITLVLLLTLKIRRSEV
jgi:hypothetical protein